MSLQWYVLRSKPNKEMALWREVAARGHDCFYPQLHVKPADPRNRKIRPYFPGYLFLNADVEALGTSMFQWMPFSCGLLAFDGVPATVPHTMVQAIRRHVDEINAAGGEQMVGLAHGDVVLIEGGPFEGYEAIFDARLPGSTRVRVFLRLLQARQMNVELPAGQIRKKSRR